MSLFKYFKSTSLFCNNCNSVHFCSVSQWWEQWVVTSSLEHWMWTFIHFMYIAIYIANNNEFWATIGVDHAKLVLSCHVSNLLKALCSFSNTPSEMWLCDYVITSYLLRVLWTDINYEIYFYEILLSQKIRLFMKILKTSYTLSCSFVIKPWRDLLWPLY